MSLTTPTTVAQLEERLSEPSPRLIAAMRELSGDVMLLGVAGKIGPSLARMLRRASDAAGISRRIYGVSRFSSGDLEAQLREQGIEPIKCDLLDEAEMSRLPQVPHVIFMAGMKFGAFGHETALWAANTYVPTLVCRHFKSSRMIVFSTGNVYGLTSAAGSGSQESDALHPVGEYAMSCLGRERMFDYFSRAFGIPMAIVRLNYATELRYGVLVDLAQKVWRGESIDLAMGHFNIIWQGDVNELVLRLLAHVETPPLVINMTSAERFSVREIVDQLAQRMNKPVNLTGKESDTALLSNTTRLRNLLGEPEVGIQQMLDWTAEWVMRGGASLGKPTHFERRDGLF